MLPDAATFTTPTGRPDHPPVAEVTKNGIGVIHRGGTTGYLV